MELLPSLSQPSTGSVMSLHCEEDASACPTCAGSVSTFSPGVCGLAIETSAISFGRESAFLRGCPILVKNIPALKNTAKAHNPPPPNHTITVSVCTFPLFCLPADSSLSRQLPTDPHSWRGQAWPTQPQSSL